MPLIRKISPTWLWQQIKVFNIAGVNVLGAHLASGEQEVTNHLVLGRCVLMTKALKTRDALAARHFIVK